jgi:hypothetical protein
VRAGASGAVGRDAQGAATSGLAIEQRVQTLVPSLEDYIATNMKGFER